MPSPAAVLTNALAAGKGTNSPTPAAAEKSPGDQPLPEGMIDFRGADITQVLEIYSMLVNRTLLRPTTLPTASIVLKTQGQLTVREGIQALEAMLALNGVTMVPTGDKFMKVVAEPQSGSAAAAFSTNNAAQLPELGQYVTHLVQLTNVKPSEVVAALTPFMKIPNAILPLDANQMLVLRDYSENVKRMLEMISKIDVAVPSEFVQEVIPIKYAKATEIAGALNSLSGAAGSGGSSGGSSGSSRTAGSRGATGRTGMPGNAVPGMPVPPGGPTLPGANPAAAGTLMRRINRTPRWKSAAIDSNLPSTACRASRG